MPRNPSGPEMAARSLYRPELDVLRFVAFLMVFLHHVLPREVAEVAGLDPLIGRLTVSTTQSLGFGLTLFFTLSAFIMTRLLREEQAATGTIRVGDFYVRRILRIWPLYALGLAIGFLLAEATDGPQGREMIGWFSLFLGNWWFLDHGWAVNPMTPLWSISVEEQFYLVLPLLLVITGARGGVRLGVAAIALGFVATWIQGERHLAIDTAIWTNTTTHLAAFGVGIALGEVTRKGAPFRGALGRAGLVVFALVAFFLAADVFDAKRIAEARSGFDVAFGHGLAAFAAGALILAVLDLRVTFPAMLLHLGKISFGLYVFHLLALRWVEATVQAGPVADAVLALGLDIVVASVSYAFWEKPFLALRRRFQTIASRPI
ncbi:MAG: acyltransferase [Siculibacillus sp.]|nr:acyltransferase [Siculibacillus sp.]